VLAGVVLGSYLPFVPLLIVCILMLAAVLLALGERRVQLTIRQGSVLYGGLLAGILLWTASTWEGAGSPPVPFDGQGPVSVTGTVVEPPRHAPTRTVLVLSSLQIGDGAEPRAVAWKLRVTWREPDRTFSPGDQVRLAARLHLPSGTLNPGGFDYGAYLVLQGIDAVASVSGTGRVALVASPPRLSRWTPWRIVEEWRGRIRDAALRTLPDPARGIYLGIVVGEQGYLAQDVRDVFMATGTVHILSISGSHLGLVAWLSFFFVQGACRLLPARWLLALSRRVTPTRLAAAATIVLAVFYTLLAGAEVATVRSLVMVAMFLLAVWLGRARDLLRAVACAALLIVVQNPRALFDISFQLSYLAVLAIALVVARRSGEESDGLPPRSVTPWETAGRWAREYVWLTGGVTLATLPLVAYYFKQIAWVGLIANAVVVPLAGFVLVPLGLGSAVWLLATGGDSLPAAAANEGMLELFSGVVSLFAKLPGVEWHVASPALAAVVVFYGLLWMASRPVPDREDRLRRRACVAVVGLLIGWWAWSPRWSDGETLRVTFLDVGQGDACVLELPDGQMVLIDGGARYDTLDMGRAVVAPYLWEKGISRLDHVIATHPQLDHVGGLAWIVRSFDVGRYWSNGVARDEPFYRQLQDVLRAKGLTEEGAAEGRPVIESGPCRLLILNPPAEPDTPARSGGAAAAAGGSVLNDRSIVTTLTCGIHSLLFTADVETGALARLHHRGVVSDATVIKVPHHGAASSLYEPWITGLKAHRAIVSVGRHNAYGHPAAAVVAAYERTGIRLLRTDRDGAVSLTGRLSDPELHIRTAREQVLRPVPIGRTGLSVELSNWERFARNLIM